MGKPLFRCDVMEHMSGRMRSVSDTWYVSWFHVRVGLVDEAAKIADGLD